MVTIGPIAFRIDVEAQAETVEERNLPGDCLLRRTNGDGPLRSGAPAGEPTS
jgi:hypothetical protein